MNSHLSIYFSEFSHHFSTVIYSRSANLKNIKFSNSLDTAVIISNDVFQKKTYKKRQELTDDSSRFESCLFHKISSSKNDGGAIKIDLSDATIKIIQCGFSSCSTGKNGGAIYAICKRVTIDNSCTLDCSSSKNGASYYVSKTTNFELKDNLIQNCKGQTAVTFKAVNSAEFTHLNMTKNSGDDTVFSLSDIVKDSSKFQYNHFSSNDGDLIFSFSSSDEIDFWYTNFISNSGQNALFSSDSGVYIIESYVQKDKSTSFVKSSKEIVLRDCYFDISEEECKKKLGNGSVVRPSYSVEKTMDIKIITEDCALKESSTTNMKLSVIFAIVAAAFILLLILYLVVRKFCCFRFADDDPLIRRYTL